MMARTGAARRSPNAVLASRASCGLLPVSTMIDPLSPWIRITLLAEYPTATYTPSVTRITSWRNSWECARSFSRPANAWPAAVPQRAISITTASAAADCTGRFTKIMLDMGGLLWVGVVTPNHCLTSPFSLTIRYRWGVLAVLTDAYDHPT